MISLEQALALKPGDKVYIGSSNMGSFVYTEWTVYEPPAGRRFEEDGTVVCYLDGGNGIQSYVFSDELYNYYLKKEKRR